MNKILKKNDDKYQISSSIFLYNVYSIMYSFKSWKSHTIRNQDAMKQP